MKHIMSSKVKTIGIVGMLALSGCTTLPYARGTAEEALQEAGELSDGIMDATHDLLCSKRFSLRAYWQRYGARWSELAIFCQWDATPPAPPAGVIPRR